MTWRKWLRRRWSRDLIVVAWLVACGLTTKQFGISADVMVWVFFGGIAALVTVMALPVSRSRMAKASVIPLTEPNHAKWKFPLLIGLTMIVTFTVGMLWPSADRLLAAKPVGVSPQTTSTASFPCRVASIHDGDTLRCADGTRIRLHAVAARELDGTCTSGHPCPSASAEAAREALVSLAANDTLNCVSTGNSYNRITAICRNSRGVEINCAMVQSGTALLWDRFNRESPICSQ